MLRFGSGISPNEVEWMTSAWGAEGPARFAALADAVAGWEAYRIGLVPELTGRIFAKDGGIDGKVHVDDLKASRLPPASLLVGGWNVLQYKFKDCRSARFEDRLKDLCRKVSGAWNLVCQSLGTWT